MNRAARRAQRKNPRPGEVFPVTECICDGYPCPYCSEVTAPSDDGIWRCMCGWSGVLVTT